MGVVRKGERKTPPKLTVSHLIFFHLQLRCGGHCLKAASIFLAMVHLFLSNDNGLWMILVFAKCHNETSLICRTSPSLEVSVYIFVLLCFSMSEGMGRGCGGVISSDAILSL